MKKDTVYIDIEDDITAIIDKAKSAKSKIVAVVPPKRSTVLNSAVNMKLLAKSLEENKKRLVLVTSEPALIGLAGGLEIHVTSNLHSKPSIPERNANLLDENIVIDGEDLDPSAPIGELAEVHEATENAGEGKLPQEAKSKKKSKKLGRGLSIKIPSFERFRTRLILMIVAVTVVGVGWWWAFWVAPEATIAINAQTRRIETTLEFTINTELEADDFSKNQFVATKQSISRDVTEPFTPSGKKNVGDKASGQMTIQNCDTSDSFVVAAGTIFTSPAGFNFESLDSGDVPGGSFSGGSCTSPGEVTITVRASSPGDQYNLASGTIYDVSGLGSLVVGFGGQMAGGTNKEVTVVSQNDIDKAKKAVQDADRTAVIDDLRLEYGEEVVPINETFEVTIGKITSQPAVGEEASSANVTATITFTMLGINRDTLTKSIEDFQFGRLEGGDQTIYDNGMDDLIFTLVEKTSASNMDIKVSTDGYVGPDINTDSLASEVSGKRFSEVVNLVKSKPGVITVDVEFQPFWVFSAPKADKIDITLNVNDDSGV